MTTKAPCENHRLISHDDDNGTNFKYAEDGLENRARVKLSVLSDILKKADNAATDWRIASISYSSSQGEHEKEKDLKKLENLYQVWIESEMELSRAYSSAIKYVARTREKDAAAQAGYLLNRMIARTGVKDTNFPLSFDNPNITRKMKHEINKMWRGESYNDGTEIINSRTKQHDSSPISTSTDDFMTQLFHSNHYSNSKTIPHPYFPPPTQKDFHNVLHSWASSKARRKGLESESLLIRMAELSWRYPTHFQTMPNSKTFALVLKCFANSTQNTSMDKIIQLHDIHSAYANRHKAVHGTLANDPYLLMHSIKSIKNYRNTDQLALLDKWLQRLHSFVTDPSKEKSYHDIYKTSDDDTHPNLIDLTGTYTSIIRECTKLRNNPNATKRAKDVLQMMREVAYHNSKQKTPISKIDTSTSPNPYNLVIASCASSRNSEDAQYALNILSNMIDNNNLSLHKGKKNSLGTADSHNTVPYPIPNDKSFAFCIDAMIYLDDTDESTIKRAEELIQIMEGIYKNKNGSTFSDTLPSPTTKAYISLLELYIDTFKLKVKKNTHSDKVKAPFVLEASGVLDVVSKCRSILDKMRDLSKNYPDVAPDGNTNALFLKTCSIYTGDIMKEIEVYEAAKRFFIKIGGHSDNINDHSEGNMRINDKCYFHMMKCVAKHEKEDEIRKNQIQKLFREACNRGFVSANVMKVFRKNVSAETFVEVVGNGRLADNWIANVTSAKALYTDGTSGGANKNARRKGKSTSGWLKKQRRLEEERKSRRRRKS
eukprot:CAMPEP_0184860966 /NCGR_PEP_ID=MMETSP0580-20130426/5746_1 /TAXON_ID=1118495 /ORGANISM="Dactyliosolen fragilissimus" /LENGTH=769 /DNA_ID=CAMNT_0027358263 /DNA_START=317 /DNA_END=2626 /DNA_ORIENTATION=-